MKSPDRYICLDTESAQSHSQGHNELIELSIFNGNSEEVYASRFKPRTLRRWDTKIHHITPSMVKDAPRFSECLPEIQSIVDSADWIIGFALNNDFNALSREGVERLAGKRVIELRELYWYCVGRHHDVPLYSGPGLTKCAGELGVAVVDKEIHSASGDTRVTLDFFMHLLRTFRDSEMPGADLDADFDSVVAELMARMRQAKFDYDASRAAGIVSLMRDPGGLYYFKISATVPEADNLVRWIHVGSRRRALYELETMFSRRALPHHKSMFRLREADIESFTSYACSFDDRENEYRDLTELRRQL